ncbi:MAG TPA: hypothetical protein VMZ91_03530, partial [Candidatus Paceibacterota bacterium]|nr:hypothetical protein [Candidatus Paceibacterota bacterium]
MKIQNCKVCGKTVPEESLSMECPDCYIKGAKIEREKALTEVDRELNKILEKPIKKGQKITWEEIYDEIEELRKKLKGEELKFPKVHG